MCTHKSIEKEKKRFYVFVPDEIEYTPHDVFFAGILDACMRYEREVPMRLICWLDV